MVGIYLKEKSWLNVLFGFAIIKNIDKKNILISRNYRFFIMVDLVLSLEND